MDHERIGVSATPMENSAIVKLLSKIRGIGIIMEILGSTFITFVAYIVKIMPHVNPTHIVAIRCTLQVSFLLPVVAFTYKSHFLTSLKCEIIPVLVRGFFGTGIYVFQFYALRYIPIADVSAVLFCSPVFVNLYNCTIRRQQLTPLIVLFLLLAVVGVFLTSRPSFIFGSIQDVSSSAQLIGILLSLGGCFCLCGIYICQSYINTTPVFFGLVASATLGIAMSWIMVLIVSTDFRIDCELDSWLIIIISVLAILIIALKCLATRFENVSKLSLISTAEIPIAFILQIALLRQWPEWTSYVGASLIMLAVAGVISSAEIKKTVRHCCPSTKSKIEDPPNPIVLNSHGYESAATLKEETIV